MSFICKVFHHAFLPMLLALLCAGIGSAAPLSFTGTFTQDDDVRFFLFDLSAARTVTIQTWSYAGTAPGDPPDTPPGTNWEGDVIPPGGFAPVLSLFQPDGLLAAWDYQGMNGCPTCQADPETGVTWDAYISISLDPGRYILALSQYDNLARGPYLADGFQRSGEGNFTANFAVEGGPSAPFLLPQYWETSYKRTGAWAVDFDGVDSGGEIPEPASLMLAAAGIFLLFGPRLVGLRRIPRISGSEEHP